MIDLLSKFDPLIETRDQLLSTGVTDPFNSYRLYRISLLREVIKSFGEKPLVTSEGWGANVELLMNTAPLARRIERVTLAPRYDVRVRDSRIHPIADGMALYRFGWRTRGRKITASAAPPAQSNGSSGKTAAEAAGAGKAGS